MRFFCTRGGSTNILKSNYTHLNQLNTNKDTTIRYFETKFYKFKLILVALICFAWKEEHKNQAKLNNDKPVFSFIDQFDGTQFRA